MKNSKLSKTSSLHYVKLVYRSLILIAAITVYVCTKLSGGSTSTPNNFIMIFLGAVWVIYATEMVRRLFPDIIESPGSQKVFAHRFIPTKNTTPILQSWRRTLAVVAAWFALNAIFGVLYYTGIFDSGTLFIISLAYGVCDMICILFFCPFQAWFMKNRCCTDCRIYNWDFAMMFTPLVFIPHPYTWTLLGLALILLIRWEVTLRTHPERFSPSTNACIACQNCTERLCKHKKHLASFIKNKKYIKR